MKIVADENIPLLEPFFGSFAEIDSLPGRAITADHLLNADVLLVRSVTRVDETLLSGSRVRFVGSCTAGIDHVDCNWLQQQGIHFVNAVGCNARSVAEYVVAALMELSDRSGSSLLQRTAGVVGYGQVGQRVVQLLDVVGVKTVACDPFRSTEGKCEQVVLDELIDRCDTILLHTPLTFGGGHPTYHLLDERRLRRLRRDSWLLNAGRGGVINDKALLSLLKEGRTVSAVLDVWEGEPRISAELLQQVAIATPHIAGYSLDGKRAGTETVWRAFCQFYGLSEDDSGERGQRPGRGQTLACNSEDDFEAALLSAVRSVYDIRRDDAAIRKLPVSSGFVGGEDFDRLRKSYPVRREFDSLQVAVQPSNRGLGNRLRAVGFCVE